MKKRANDLIPLVLDPDNLRLAFWKASKGKRYTREVLAYQADLEGNLRILAQEIARGEVLVGDYRYFKVYEPKERQICASAFREQVLHHALMNVCHAYFERKQAFESYASRKDKGVYAALAQAERHTHTYDWYLKLDMRKFFESIHHGVLKSQLARVFKDAHLLHIFSQIIDSYAASASRGLPIGNLTSQYFANHYLSGLDHRVKSDLRIAAYVRYMDDMVFWHTDKAALNNVLAFVQNFVETSLCCALKPPSLMRCTTGIPFLGYHLFPYHTRLLQKSKQRFIRKLTEIDTHHKSGVWDEATCQRRALPLIAFTQHADALEFRKNVLLRLEGQLP